MNIVYIHVHMYIRHICTKCVICSFVCGRGGVIVVALDEDIALPRRMHSLLMLHYCRSLSFRTLPVLKSARNRSVFTQAMELPVIQYKSDSIRIFNRTETNTAE
jgi:hypothetical protein